MARRNDGGCGCLFGLGIVLTALAAAPFLFALPGYIGYALIGDPALLGPNAHQWGIAEAVAALLAAALVGVTRRGRLGLLRLVGRTVVLLAVTALASLATLLHEHDPPDLHRLPITPMFSAAAAAVVILCYWGIRDGLRGRPRRERVEPATVEQVRHVTAQANHSLHQVRAENDRVERLLYDLEAELAQARLRLSFASLRQLHRESYGCADRVYEHYRSTDHLLWQITRTHAGVRVALRRGLVPGRGRPDRPVYATATAEMTATQGRLRDEVDRGRGMVSTLNQRTEALKYRIRDECGLEGEVWYDDLMIRREAARAAEGR